MVIHLRKYSDLYLECQLYLLSRVWLILVAGVGNAQPRPWDYETHELTSALPRDVFGTRYGIRTHESSEWKSDVLGQLDEPSVFSGDVRSRTGVYKNVNDTLLSGCIGFEVLGTSTNYHKGGRLYIRRPIDTGQNSWLNQWPLPGSKRLDSKCVTVWWCCAETAWNCTNLVSQLLVKILSVYCLIHLRDRIIPTTKYHQL